MAELDQRNLDACNFLPLNQTANLALNNHLSLVHLNVRSLVAHLDEMEITIADLGAPTIVGLSEIWLKHENETQYGIPGYSMVTNSHIERTGGGIALLISDTIPYKLVRELQLSQLEVAESIFVETEINHTRNIIGEIYHPLTSLWPEFIQYLKRVVENLSESGCKAYLMGDFNVNSLKYPSNPHSLDLVCECAPYAFLPMVSKPARVTSNMISCIDNIFTNDLANLTRSHTFIIDSSILDHHL